MTSPAATDEALPQFEIVPASGESLAYVLSTWGRTLEKALEATPRPGFLKAFAPVQARLIKRSKVLTALDKTGRIVAFMVYEPALTARMAIEQEPHTGVLHWIQTRAEHRRQHAATQLMQHASLVKPLVTTWTNDLRHVGLADAPYTPFWLRSL